MSKFLWSNIFKGESNQVDQIAALWHKTPLFEGIPLKHIRFLSQNMHVRYFQTDEQIFRKGDQGAGAILVLQGKVRIRIGQMEPVELESGDFFGEIALAEVENRLADAISIDETTLVYFLKQDLEEWIELEPHRWARFLKNLAASLAQRVFHANEQYRLANPQELKSD